MTLALSMTGGLEWIMIPAVIALFVVCAIVAVKYYFKKQHLKNAAKERNNIDEDLIV